MLRTLILVLYCTGLRLGEAVRLSTQDVDLRRCTFMIHHSKRRSRIVPFRADLAEELRRYLAARRQLVGEHNDDPAGFFLRLHGHPAVVSAHARMSSGMPLPFIGSRRGHLPARICSRGCLGCRPISVI
jgi:integrase